MQHIHPIPAGVGFRPDAVTNVPAAIRRAYALSCTSLSVQVNADSPRAHFDNLVRSEPR